MKFSSGKIKELMKEKSVKAKDIAEKHNISLASIRSVIYGNSLNPSYKILSAFARELNCHVSEFFEESDILEVNLVKDVSFYRRILDSIMKIANSYKLEIPHNQKEILANSIFKATKDKIESNEDVDEALVRWAVNRICEKNLL